MFTKIKEFFLGKIRKTVIEAPYKIEAPVEELPLVKLGPEPTPEATKKPRAKKAATPKATATKAPAKPKAPRAPKAAPKKKDK